MVKQVLNYHDVQLYDTDVALFRSNQWLNDNAINFYFQYLHHTLCLPLESAVNGATTSPILLMDPAVVSCMMLQCDDDDEYADLGRGTDVTSKSLCLIPVNDNQSFEAESSHWSLIVYDSGRFVHYDSSAGHNTRAARQIAKAFLQLLRASGVAEVPMWSSDCYTNASDAPQQRNGFDCGVYVLMIAEFFCRNYGSSTTAQDHEASVGLSLQEYATPLRATALRQEIPRIVERLQSEEER